MKVHIGRYPKNPEKERKVFIEVKNYDVWNADGTLALLISAVMNKFIENRRYGIPFEISQKAESPISSQLAFPFYSETYEEAFECCVKEWETILQKIAWAFTEYTKDWEAQYQTGVVDITWEKVEDNEKYSRMVYGPNHTFKTNYEKIKEHQQKIDEGIELFAKYFKNLWD